MAFFLADESGRALIASASGLRGPVGFGPAPRLDRTNAGGAVGPKGLPLRRRRLSVRRPTERGPRIGYPVPPCPSTSRARSSSPSRTSPLTPSRSWPRAGTCSTSSSKWTQRQPPHPASSRGHRGRPRTGHQDGRDSRSGAARLRRVRAARRAGWGARLSGPRPLRLSAAKDAEAFVLENLGRQLSMGDLVPQRPWGSAPYATGSSSGSATVPRPISPRCGSTPSGARCAQHGRVPPWPAWRCATASGTSVASLRPAVASSASSPPPPSRNEPARPCR